VPKSLAFDSPKTVHASGLIVGVRASHGGWGGYVSNIPGWKAWFEALIDAEYAQGLRAFRYWARPLWYFGAVTTNTYNQTICDEIVHYCYNKPEPMTVIIDPEQVFPNGAYINSSTQLTWENDLLGIGLRYQNYSNIILECVGEYTGSDQVTLYNAGMAYLRANGVTCPLLWNFWWNQPCVTLTDPLNNYAIGRHFYAPSGMETVTHSYPADLTTVITDYYANSSNIMGTMNSYFRSNNIYYIKYAVQTLKIPCGFFATEVGPAASDPVLVARSWKQYGLAYMMQFLREAKANNVTVTAYMVGNQAGYDQNVTESNNAYAWFNAGNNTVFPPGTW
jgi:hypothetical protein